MNGLVENYKSNKIAKIPLKEITEHFKGKAVSKIRRWWQYFCN